MRFLVAGLAACILMIIFYSLVDNDEIKITLYPVESGDSALISIENKKHILIDGGSSKRPINDLKGLIFKSRFRLPNLDHVIVTHPDEDHFKGLIGLIGVAEIKKIYLPKSSTAIGMNVGYVKLLKMLEKKKIPIAWLNTGRYIIHATNTTFIELIVPLCNKDTNCSSIITVIKYGIGTYIFTGDMDKAEWSEISVSYNIPRNVMFLKVPHHGARANNFSEMTEHFRPQYVGICVGRRNIHGHPHPSVIDLYARDGARISRTDYDGEIVFTADFNGIKHIRTEKSRKP